MLIRNAKVVTCDCDFSIHDSIIIKGDRISDVGEAELLAKDFEGGPVIDMGPYFFTSMVNLLGPAKNIRSRAVKFSDKRQYKAGPKKGNYFNVEIPTSYMFNIEFLFYITVSSNLIMLCLLIRLIYQHFKLDKIN